MLISFFDAKRSSKTICDALRDLVPFVQFEKREKHPWRSVNFSKVAAWSRSFTKISTARWVFFTFFKLCKCYQIAQRTTYSSASQKQFSIVKMCDLSFVLEYYFNCLIFLWKCAFLLLNLLKSCNEIFVETLTTWHFLF